MAEPRDVAAVSAVKRHFPDAKRGGIIAQLTGCRAGDGGRAAIARVFPKLVRYLQGTQVHPRAKEA